MDTKVDLPRNVVVLVFAGYLLIGNTGALGAEYHNTLTINSARVAGDLNDFVVYVDLADMMDGFWNNVTTGSGTTDIVVKNAGGTVLSREIVWLDKDSRKGEMHFKADFLSGTSDTSFAISVGGGSLTHNRGTDTWSNGYLGIWHLGEATDAPDHSDSTAADKEGHRNGNTYDANGRFGAAQRFDGSDDYIDLGSLGISDNSPLTVSGWVLLSQLPADDQHETIWNSYSTDDDRIHLIVHEEDSYLTGFSKVSGDTTLEDIEINKVMSTNTWQYVALSLDYSTSAAKLYLDDAASTKQYLGFSADNHRIGAILRESGYNHFLDGLIDEFRISNVVRSAEWILTEYNNQSSPGTFYEALPDPATLMLLCGGAAAAVLFGPKPKRSREKDLPT